MKISVKNLGKISTADVELRPLRIFVGKNNTGKSYLATAIWAIGNIDNYSLAEQVLQNGLPGWLDEFLTAKDPIGTSIEINRDRWKELVAIAETNLSRTLDQYLTSVYAVGGFEKTELAATELEFSPFLLEISADPWAKILKDGPNNFSLRASWDGGKHVDLLTFFTAAETDLRTPRAIGEIIGSVIFGRDWSKYSRQMYIPASRTGLMLALPSLIETTLGSHRANALNLPAPLRSFLSTMSRDRNLFNTPASDEAVQTIRDLIGGEINTTSGQVGVFRYKPHGHDIELPMHAISSMIAELTPLLIAAENAGVARHYVLEEPEAHLHLEAQREIARLIARLISSGAHITLTTHSDTFLQEINNLMKLHEHPQRDRMLSKLGYKDCDMIDPALAVAYEFTSTDGKSRITKLEKSDAGFIVPSLNDTLISLAEDTLLLSAPNDD